MATPPQAPNPGNFPPGDPRNGQFWPNAGPDPRWTREQQRDWQRAQRDQANAWKRAQRDQAKAWKYAQRDGRRLQKQQTKQAAIAYRDQVRAYARAGRAESLVGPLLLIAVAVAALLVYQGRIAFPVLLGWFARWWPLLLIAAGVVRVIEWAVARARSVKGATPLRFSMGGGTVFLLILLVAAGVSSQAVLHTHGRDLDITSSFFDASAHGGNWQQFFGARHDEDTPAITQAIAPNGTLEIDNSHGDVTVSGSSSDGSIHIALHKEVFAGSDAAAQRQLTALSPQFSGSAGNLQMRVSGGESSIANLTVQVPSGVHVVVNADRGNITLAGLHAAATVTANRGDSNVSDVIGDTRIHMNSRHGSTFVRGVKGEVSLEGSGDDVNLSEIDGPVRVRGDFFGAGRLEAITGKVEYDAGRIGFGAARIDGELTFDSNDALTLHGAAGPVFVHTRGRDVNLTQVSGEVHVSNSNGAVNLSMVPPTGAIEIDNRDGDVNVTLAAKARFTLAAETTDGTVGGSFPGLPSQAGPTMRGTMTAAINGGGPAMRISTTHGNIQIGTNTATPVAPARPLSTFSIANRGALPADAKASLQEAEAQLVAAQQEVARAQQEANRERTQALAEAAKERSQALQEAAQERAEGQKQAAQERSEALREAEQERHQADQERANAQRDADRQRQQALREAEEARRKAMQAVPQQ